VRVRVRVRVRLRLRVRVCVCGCVRVCVCNMLNILSYVMVAQRRLEGETLTRNKSVFKCDP